MVQSRGSRRANWINRKDMGKLDHTTNHRKAGRNRAHIILGIHSPLCLLTDGNCDKVESPGCCWIDSKLFNLQQSSEQYGVSHTTAWRQSIAWFNAQDLWLHVFPRRLGESLRMRETHSVKIQRYSWDAQMYWRNTHTYVYVYIYIYEIISRHWNSTHILNSHTRDAVNLRIQYHNKIYAILSNQFPCIIPSHASVTFYLNQT